MAALRVIVSPPSPSGGRRVRVDGTILGLAHGLRDLVEFLRRAGLEGVDEAEVARLPIIEWRGGGPDVWAGPET
ncbi:MULTISPECIES: hypothetical protein [unclassified Streptomyces]|uniref:hypothetical protein n=1 Tax=unclassified Streptomyces TaxID=2593676 RepID=UPI0009399539|nr:hypothetical protein [Streptomyces sp. TSRI0281]OKI34986.1 hypothetical protein A6A29_16305 [Streptomyces sp. TSRI0281]